MVTAVVSCTPVLPEVTTIDEIDTGDEVAQQ